jgi:hypothetical protein
MPQYSFPQSVRKYIRLSKAAIRRQVFDTAEQTARISKLYEDMAQRYQGRTAARVAAPIISPKPQEPVSSKKEK